MTIGHMIVVAAVALGVACVIVFVEELDHQARRRRRHIARLEDMRQVEVFDQAVDLPDREQTILEGVRRHGPVSAAELARRVEGRDATTAFRARLKALEERNLVGRDEQGAWVPS